MGISVGMVSGSGSHPITSQGGEPNWSYIPSLQKETVSLLNCRIIWKNAACLMQRYKTI